MKMHIHTKTLTDLYAATCPGSPAIDYAKVSVRGMVSGIGTVPQKVEVVILRRNQIRDFVNTHPLPKDQYPNLCEAAELTDADAIRKSDGFWKEVCGEVSFLKNASE
ncbi:MAG TPA: hypothetical protein VGJ82_01440 [Thermoanaerobaculia bacterium]|jgi:hypothetical protein